MKGFHLELGPSPKYPWRMVNPTRKLRGIFSSASSLQSVAVGFFTLSLTYALAAFPNIPPLRVLLLLSILAVLPMVLILREPGYPDRPPRASSPSALLLGLTGGAFFLAAQTFLIGGVWSDYYPNFSDERFEVGGGYSIDTAYHISLVRGIMQFGYPTTGLDGGPLTVYHVLSHYVDAIALLASGLDPWESMSLLFYSKLTAVILAFLWALSKVTTWKTRVGIVGIALVFFLAFWNDGYLVGSYANWLPTYVMLLLTPGLHKALNSNSPPSSRNMLAATLVVLSLSAGKISMGFVFALFVSTWWVVRWARAYPKILIRLVILGTLWAGCLYLFGGTFERERARLDYFSLLDRIWPHVWWVTFAIVINTIFWLASQRIVFLQLAVTMGLVVVVLFILPATVMSGAQRADVFLFFIALTGLTMLIVVPIWLNHLWENFSSLEEQGKGPSAIHTLLSICLVVLSSVPLLIQSRAVAEFDLSKVVSNAKGVSSQSFEWYNESTDATSHLSVVQVISGNRPLDTKPYLELARSEVNKLFAGQASRETRLVLSREDFDYLIREFGRGENRADQEGDIALLVRAALGYPLLFGVEQDRFTDGFGFQSYAPDRHWKTEAELEQIDFCSFRYEVVLFDAVEPAKSKVACP